MEELFGAQIEYIRKFGIVEWLKKYPVNPITMVGFVLMIVFFCALDQCENKEKSSGSVETL